MSDVDGVLLQTERLTRAYGSLIAVDRVDVTVRKGELRSIIGPNGAGKTTFFRLISGETTPTSGRIIFDGHDITGLPQHRVARLGIAKSYQITNIFPHLSILENVRVAAQGYTRSFNFWSRADALTDTRQRAMAILEEIGLAKKSEILAAHLSHGEKRHLEVAIALASEPTLLLLDEPTAGMNAQETEGTRRLILKIRELGISVVVIEHDTKFIFTLCDRVLVLVQGELLVEGTPDVVRGDPRVIEAYLGAPPDEIEQQIHAAEGT
jgi:branched-chain amino acid transport system ATP-binding protein